MLSYNRTMSQQIELSFEQLTAMVDKLTPDQWASEQTELCIDRFIATLSRKSQEAKAQKMRDRRDTLHASLASEPVVKELQRIRQQQMELEAQSIQLNNQRINCESVYLKQLKPIYEQCSYICGDIGHVYKPFKPEHFHQAPLGGDIFDRCIYCGDARNDWMCCKRV